MHVVVAGTFADPLRRSPDALLAAWPALVGLVRALAAADARVTVVQAAAHDAERHCDEGVFRFVAVPGTRRGALSIARVAAAQRPDVIHLNGVRFPLHVAALRRACPRVPILARHHADALPGSLRAALERPLLRGLDAIIVTATAQAEPLLRSGLLPRRIAVYEAPAASSTFTPGDRTAARRAFGLDDAPVIAWVGRLAAIKDPFTALAALRIIGRTCPHAQLCMAFGEAPLERAIIDAIAADDGFAPRVRLLGRLPHSDVELLLRAADAFLSTSRSESTGFALIEALACGTPAVVSDIPAHRAITASGSIGALFAPGDAAAAAAALLTALREPPHRIAVRRHFDAHLSQRALGTTLCAAYDAQLARRADHNRVGTGAVSSTAPAMQPAFAASSSAAARGRRLRVCMLVPGGVDASGRERVIPCLLALTERLAHAVDLHVLALRQTEGRADYELLGAHVHSLPRRSRTAGIRWLLEPDRRDAFDVLHAIWMHPQGTTAAAVRPLLRRPVLLHVNGGDLADEPDIRYGGRASGAGRLRLRLAVRGADCITVPSALTQRRAVELGFTAERLTFGVPIDRWPVRDPVARRPGEPLRLVSVGSLNVVKDHATLLRAVALLRARGVRVLLHCVGEDTLGGSVQRLAGGLELGGVVSFGGFVPHAELRPCFERADALVVSSRWEADPVAALEAATAGLAVVGTRVGHLAEWAPVAALACAPGDADGLAASINAIAGDDALRLRLAAAAQRRALVHDADAAAGRVLALYEELAAHARV